MMNFVSWFFGRPVSSSQAVAVSKTELKSGLMLATQFDVPEPFLSPRGVSQENSETLELIAKPR